MNYRLQIQKLLIKRDAVNLPNDKINFLKQAIQLSDLNNDIEWGVELRLELISTEKNTSRCIESIPAFAWILDTFDQNPGLFEEKEFLWEYKWMIGSLRRNSSMSMEQIESISEDFKIRLQRNGFSLRPYYTTKAHLAFFIGNIDDARKYIDLRDKEMRDSMSNCRACELDDNLELELLQGNLEKALSMGDDMLSKRQTCAHMPFNAYCSLVKYYLLAGELDKAHDFFVKAEADLSNFDLNDSSPLSSIASLIMFLTQYDREKAWLYFERYAAWNVDSEEYIDFLFSYKVLPLLKEGGVRTMEMSSQLSWYRIDNTYNIDELYKYYSDKARDLASKFDKRNGTDYLSKEMERSLYWFKK